MLLFSLALNWAAHFWLAQTPASTDNSFDQLGTLFLGGILAAIGVALVVVFVRLKVQNRREAVSDYVSINPSKHDGRS